MDEDAREPAGGRDLTEAELAGATLEALVVRLHAARRNAVLARARADYCQANNNHREAILHERLVAAGGKLAQAERKAIVESNPDVLKGWQQAVIHAKEAALWSAEAEALRLYLLTRGRLPADGPGEGEGAGSGAGAAGLPP